MDTEDPETGSSQKTTNLASENSELRRKIDDSLNQTFSMQDFQKLTEDVNSDDLFAQHHGVIGIRKLLSIEISPPIEEVVQAGLIPTLMKFIQRDDQPHLQLEAAWALTNVASGTSIHVKILVDSGIIHSFIFLLSSSHLELAEQAIWGLGNIAGDSSQYRDQILDQGGVKILSDFLKQPKVLEKISLAKIGAWALSNFCRGKPIPQKEKVKDAVPVFCSLIQTQTDEETLIDSLWGLAFLSELAENEQTMIPMGVIPSVLKHLDSEKFSLVIPSVRIIGNIACTMEQGKILLNIPDLILKLFALLDSPKKSIRKDICWTLSNLLTGSPPQIEIVIKEPANIQKLVHIIRNDLSDVQKEAAYAFSNALADCDLNQALTFDQNGVLECFVSLLDTPDPRTILVALIGIERFLLKGLEIPNEAGENPFLNKLKEIEGISKIENLQTHANNEVYEKAFEILDKFLELEG